MSIQLTLPCTSIRQPEVIIPTVMASFAFSAILTGIVFMLLGRFRLGALIGFFPR